MAKARGLHAWGGAHLCGGRETGGKSPMAPGTVFVCPLGSRWMWLRLRQQLAGICTGGACMRPLPTQHGTCKPVRMCAVHARNQQQVTRWWAEGSRRPHCNQPGGEMRVINYKAGAVHAVMAPPLSGIPKRSTHTALRAAAYGTCMHTWRDASRACPTTTYCLAGPLLPTS